MACTTEILQQLIAAAEEEVPAAVAISTALEALPMLRREGLQLVDDDNAVSMKLLTAAMGQLIKNCPLALGLKAAAFYAGLLTVPDAPVGTLFEPVAFSACLQCMKRVALPVKGATAGNGATQAMPDEGYGEDIPMQDAGEEEAPNPDLCLSILDDIAVYTQRNSMKTNPEMLGVLIDISVDLTRSTVTAAPAAAGRGRSTGAGRSSTGSMCESAYNVLQLLVSARHGDLQALAASVMHKLTPAILGQAQGQGQGGKRGGSASGADRRASAVDFVNKLHIHEPSLTGCLQALHRHICLRVPDKADARAMANTSLQALVPREDLGLQRHLSLFLYRLSCTGKIGNRLMAVEAANMMLIYLDPPFASQILAGTGLAAGEELAANWGSVCLAILLQRASDKAAGVRSKAMTFLAEVVTSFQKDLMTGIGSPQHMVAKAFLPALCAASHIEVRVRGGAPAATTEHAEPGAGKAKEKAKTKARRTRRAAQDDGDSDAEGSEAGADWNEGGGAQAENAVGETEKGGEAEAAGAEAATPPTVTVDAVIKGPFSLDPSWMLELARSRCSDDKAAVRRSGLLVLQSLLVLRAAQPGGHAEAQGSEPSQQDLDIIEAATCDSLLSVRKTALLVACTMAKQFAFAPCVAELWVRSVLPMVRDPESTVQDAVLDQASSLLLERVTRGSEGAEEVSSLLAAIARMGRAASGCLHRICALLGQRKQLQSKQVAQGLEAIIDAGLGSSSRCVVEGAWIVLCEVAAQDAAAPSWQFLQRCWQQLGQGSRGVHAYSHASGQEGALLLWVISHAASRFPVHDAEALADGLLQAVMDLNLTSAPLAAHITALHRLTKDGAAGGGGSVGAPKQWCPRVYATCNEALGRIVDARGQADAAAYAHAECALFALGEVALLREARAPDGLVVAVQALTAAAPSAEQGTSKASQVLPAPGANAPSSLQERYTSVETLATVASSRLHFEEVNVQADRHASYCGQGYAWSTLGKLCMVDEQLAKKCAPLLVQELSHASSPVARNNLLVCLADMCVQYTALVDAHVGRLAAAVRDPHELVRRQALALLANLLVKDYVKLRGALFHRFTLALVDPCPDVAMLAQHILGDALSSKAPLLAYNHFVEVMFAINDCRAGMYGGRIGAAVAHMAAAGGANTAHHLKGPAPEMRAARDVVYRALLLRMTSEQKFATAAKLSVEVLSGVADGQMPLNEASCAEVLGDALRVLGSKEAKVSVSKLASGGDDDAELAAATAAAAGAGATQAAAAAGAAEAATKARGKLVSSMMRKHLVESVVPLLVELRAQLSAARSPLLGPLAATTAALLKDYKAEVEDILVADKQLAKEILYDMKQFEQQAKQAQQLQAQQAMQAAHQGVQGMTQPAGATAGTAAAGRTIPAGLTPGRTPLAEQVLSSTLPAPASQQEPAGQQSLPGSLASSTLHLRHTTPGKPLLAAAGAGAHAAAYKTPGVGSLAGSARGRTLLTPKTGGSIRLAGTSVLPLVSPAPLSVRAQAQQAAVQQQPGQRPAPLSALAAGLADSPGRRAVVTVPLPSPGAGEQALRQWNINLPADGDAAATAPAAPSDSQAAGRSTRRQRAGAGKQAAAVVAECSVAQQQGAGAGGGSRRRASLAVAAAAEALAAGADADAAHSLGEHAEQDEVSMQGMEAAEDMQPEVASVAGAASAGAASGRQASSMGAGAVSGISKPGRGAGKGVNAAEKPPVKAAVKVKAEGTEASKAAGRGRGRAAAPGSSAIALPKEEEQAGCGMADGQVIGMLMQAGRRRQAERSNGVTATTTAAAAAAAKEAPAAVAAGAGNRRKRGAAS